MRTILAGLCALALLATSSPAFSAPCRDAKGRYTKCIKASAKPTHCRLKGKFVKCSTPGAKPA
jgi:hypothetical protein